MAVGNVCVCHDNQFNREVACGNFFFSGKDSLRELIGYIEGLQAEKLVSIRVNNENRIENYYNWDRVANLYLDAVRDLVE